MCEAARSAALWVMSSRPQGNSGMAQAHLAQKGGAVMEPPPLVPLPLSLCPLSVEMGPLDYSS